MPSSTARRATVVAWSRALGPAPPALRPLAAPGRAMGGYLGLLSPEVEAMVASARIGAVERIGSAIELRATGYSDNALGDAVHVHAFLAADVEGGGVLARLARSRALIEGAGLGEVVGAESLVVAGDALRVWVGRRWPHARWHREIPIEGIVPSSHGERRVSGIMDLLLETEEGYVLVDHKTFPARAESAWRAKCLGFAPQLAAYAWLLDRVGEKRVRGVWVHLPVGGGAVEVRFGGRR